MDMKQLQAMGAFGPSNAIVRRDIELKVPPLKPESEWSDPSIPEADLSAEFEVKTLTFYIKKRSSVDFYEMIAAEDRLKPFVAILRCVCDDKGQQVFPTMEIVERMGEWLWMPLARAVTEVNEYGPKNSRPRMSSGTKSLPSSSAARSRKPRNASVKKNARSGSPTGTSVGL